MARLCLEAVDEHLAPIPLKFILVDRWKNIFSSIGFVDKACLYINAYVRDDPTKAPLEETRHISLARSLCLCQVLVLRDVSLRIKKRFPDMQSLVESGFLQAEEKEMLEDIQFEGTPSCQTQQSNSYKYWIPISWLFVSCYKLRQRTLISSDVLLNALMLEVRHYSDCLQRLCNYDWPECLVRTKYLRTKSDIWSLGMPCLMEAANGTLPYKVSNNTLELMVKIRDDSAPQMATANEEISQGCCDFINTCLNKDPAERASLKDLCEHPLIRRMTQYFE